MPTVMQHQDARTAAAHGFLLDAGELCSHSFIPSLSDLGKASCPLHIDLQADSQGADANSLLLGSLACSDDALSSGISHGHGSMQTAAMQFLLLDDDEVAAVVMAADQVKAVDAYPLAAPMAAPVASLPSMLRQCSNDSSDATRASAPYVDSSAMLSDLYCLAVVDEVTGLPLRPATPEETWEVERCFVLQQQSELQDVLLPPQPQPMQQLQQDEQRAASLVAASMAERAASAAAESLQGIDAFAAASPLQPAAEREDSRSGVEGLPDGGELEEGSRIEEPAAAVSAPRPSARRPDQPRRCGPCDNCGATESPQWRQGPPAKPLLCNACGMRFRRTNQLIAGETGASGSRGGARTSKKQPFSVVPPPPSIVIEQRPRSKPVTKSTVAPPLVAPDAKRPRRAAAVAAAATFAAIDVV